MNSTFGWVIKIHLQKRFFSETTFNEARHELTAKSRATLQLVLEPHTFD